MCRLRHLKINYIHCWNCRICEECQQHLRRQLKHVSMNNWNHAEYIGSFFIIEQISMCNSTLTYTTCDQDDLLSPVLQTKKCILCNLWWFCRSQISCQHFNIYLIIKRWKSLYGIKQLDDMYCNSNNACYRHQHVFWLMKEVCVWQLSIAKRQESKSEQINNLLSQEKVTHFTTRGIALGSALNIEPADVTRRD